MDKNLLILFAKWPMNNQSKSRIASEIGREKTEKFCFACLDDVASKLKSLEGLDVVIVPNTLEESKLFFNRYNLRSISLEELNIDNLNSKSKVFHKLFSFFLQRYDFVSLIPMDIPHISLESIYDSFESLKDHKSVFGPEVNGGVYLMGLSSANKNHFEGVRWSTESSFSDLIKNFNGSAVLEESFDLNTLGDLRFFNQQMLYSCPNLRKFIKSELLPIINSKKEVIIT